MKKTRIKISHKYLKEILHLPDNIEIDLVYTPNEREVYKPNVFEIILSGDGLSDKFTIEEGNQIAIGNISMKCENISGYQRLDSIKVVID